MSEKKREVNAFGKRNPFTSIIKGNIGIIAVLIIMCVIVSIATDKFLTTNFNKYIDRTGNDTRNYTGTH